MAKEAAAMILLDDNFASIVAAIEQGRTVCFNIKKFVTFILLSNIPEIVPYMLQFFLRIPLPLGHQILSIDLGQTCSQVSPWGARRWKRASWNGLPMGKYERILD